METLKKFDTVSNPAVKPFFNADSLSQYDDYIKKICEKSKRQAILAWQKTKDIILDASR